MLLLVPIKVGQARVMKILLILHTLVREELDDFNSTFGIIFGCVLMIGIIGLVVLSYVLTLPGVPIFFHIYYSCRIVSGLQSRRCTLAQSCLPNTNEMACSNQKDCRGRTLESFIKACEFRASRFR